MKTVLTLVWILNILFARLAVAENLNETINSIIRKSGISEKNLGIFIAENESVDSILIKKNENEKFIPASISKLVTAAAFIQAIPPGTKFVTRLYSDAQIVDKELKGHLYLKGGGDPGFVSESMWFLVNAFLRTGIKKIQGDIIVDDSLFDQLRFDPSRQSVRVDRAYDAPTGAMSFNWNSVNIFIRPGKNKGDPAFVYADPENDYIILKSSVKTVANSSTQNIEVEREESKKTTQNIIYVKGEIGLGAKEAVVYKNITHPDIWSGTNLASFLKQRGIEFGGKVRNGITPKGATVLAEQESKPIENMLVDMNKFSNNYIAEMLTKNLGAQDSSVGSIPGGMEKIKNYLKSIGIKENDFYLANPSGLTRENKITAQALWKVLLKMKDEFQFHPEYMVSLPIAGVDGTLKKRMKNTHAERWVRAKTGFLTNVISLAGYIGKKDGTVIPFVMMFNGQSDENQVRQLFDKICAAVAE